MTTPVSPSVSPLNAATSGSALPPDLANTHPPGLDAGENILAWLEIDLDTRLQFSIGHLVVSNRRLLAREAGQQIGRASCRERV